MTLNGMSKKSASIYSILVLVILVSPYVWGLLPSYATAAEFKAHVNSSDDRFKVLDDRYHQTIRVGLKKEIKAIKNTLALYGLDRNMRALTPREKLHVTQLINLKDEYVLELSEPNPR